MGIAPKQFEGRKIYQPGVYSKSYYPPQTGNNGAITNVVAVIGKAFGGIPYNANLDDMLKVNVITNLSQALNLLRGGDGYYMTEFFLTPTTDEALNKPTQVLFFRVDPATQSESKIKDSTGINDIIQLKSVRYGSYANQICRKIEAGTVTGKSITVKLAGEVVASKDNIGYECIDIQYIGGGTSCTMTINSNGLTTSVGGASGDDLNLLFADYKNVGDLVSYISALPSYSCIAKCNLDFSTKNLDAVTAVDIMTGVYTIRADIQAIIDFFNSTGELEATLVGDRVPVGNDANYVFQTGGSEGIATATDWAKTFELMEKYYINHILVATGDPIVHALAKSHCSKMSSIEHKKNRTWASGASSGKTKAERIAEAKALNDARGIYFSTPFYRYDYPNGGTKKLFAPYLAAAFDAGIRYANHITISSTFKKPNILATSEQYSYEDKDDYIKNGCTIIALNETGLYEIVHCISTYQSANLILNLPSMLRTCDFITLDSQIKIKDKIANLDRAPNALVIKSIENYLTSNLLPYYRDNGFLTDDPNNGAKAFSEVSFSVQGDAFYFGFTGIVPAPMHYGFITQRFTVVGQL